MVLSSLPSEFQKKIGEDLLMITKTRASKLDLPSSEFRYRDFEFEELLTSFRRVLTNPGEAIARVILIGPAG